MNIEVETIERGFDSYIIKVLTEQDHKLFLKMLSEVINRNVTTESAGFANYLYDSLQDSQSNF